MPDLTTVGSALSAPYFEGLIRLRNKKPGRFSRQKRKSTIARHLEHRVVVASNQLKTEKFQPPPKGDSA
jgi:hypothetical protein